MQTRDLVSVIALWMVVAVATILVVLHLEIISVLYGIGVTLGVIYAVHTTRVFVVWVEEDGLNSPEDSTEILEERTTRDGAREIVIVLHEGGKDG